MRARIKRRPLRRMKDPLHDESMSVLPLDPRDPDVLRVKRAKTRNSSGN
jgi:hypothetical protein